MDRDGGDPGRRARGREALQRGRIDPAHAIRLRISGEELQRVAAQLLRVRRRGIVAAADANVQAEPHQTRARYTYCTVRTVIRASARPYARSSRRSSASHHALAREPYASRSST